jgi:hypothetical protein
MRRKFKSVFTYLVISLLCPISGADAQNALTVPPSYSQLNAALNQAVSTFDTELDSRTQSASPTRLSAKLDSAGAGEGLSLIDSNALTRVSTQLARYTQLGVQGVVIPIGFPLLTQQFFSQNGDPQDYQKFYSFYQQVIQMCHKAKMTVLVESHPVYPSPVGTLSQQAAKYSRSLSAANFQNAIAQHNANIATLGPDLISIVNEPNTDSSWTSQPVYGSPTALAAMVQAATNAINKAVPNNKIVIAAGAASWQPDAQDYDSLFYQVKGLNAIDIHIYFLGGNDGPRAISLADNAHSNNKQVVVSECWLCKAGAGGVPPTSPGPDNATVSRAVSSFSFWQPLDEMYIYSLFKWCNVEQPQFFCFFYSQLLFSYLNYSQVQSQSDQQIIKDEFAAEKQAIDADQFTPTGLYYSKLLQAPRQSHY